MIPVGLSSDHRDEPKPSEEDFGKETPFWYKPELKKSLGFEIVKPKEETFKKYAKYLKAPTETMPILFAAKYPFQGRNLLLIRVSTYRAKDWRERIAWYKAVVEENEATVDALVIDQTRNFGGIGLYSESLVSLFATGQTRGSVRFPHADRAWLKRIGGDIAEVLKSKDGEWTEDRHRLELSYRLIEQAYDKNLPWTEQPIIDGTSPYIQSLGRRFAKPVLLLIDRTCVSAGDKFPMLMKENGLATLFGERTIGGGGNVEEVAWLPHSGAVLKMTRSLFMMYEPNGQYDFSKAIENNGVEPDIRYSHTLKDFRAGYSGYIEAFSNAAIGLVGGPSKAEPTAKVAH
jgi:hypothetical protein